MDGQALSVDMILGVAAGYLQYKALSDSQAAWDAYASVVHGFTGDLAPLVTPTDNLTTEIDASIGQMKLAALIGIGAQLLNL